ncbi:hypothetical protein [Candidatus Nanohalobium constans]|uniref:hypothetical protein n=1 Tax=Candidatus Nanohalobium constans TaxID=2565781 RepID=UPI0012984EC2|nr:hypothetical protein [Candidatus Nanohalobium constans]
MKKHTCRRIAATVFLTSTLLTVLLLQKLEFNQLISITSAIFIGSITAGIWLETSYRFLVKQATAPLDKLVEKL